MHGTFSKPPPPRREWPPHVTKAVIEWFRAMLRLAYSREGAEMTADEFRAIYEHEWELMKQRLNQSDPRRIAQ